MKKIILATITILMAGMFVGCASAPTKNISKQEIDQKAIFREKISNEEKIRGELCTDITGMIINDSAHIQHFMFQVFGYDLDKHEYISKDRFFLLTDVQPYEAAYFKIPDSLKIGDTSFMIYAWDFENKKYVPIFTTGTFMFTTRSIQFEYNGTVIDRRTWQYTSESVSHESYDKPYKITFVKAFEVKTSLEEYHF